MSRADSDDNPIIKFYVDAHIAKQLTIQLRFKRVDVVRCQELGFGDESDLFHFEYASREKRTIVTSDTDFFNLANKWQSEGRFHAGVVYIAHEQKDNIGLLVSELVFLHEAVLAGAATLDNDVYNKVIFVG